MLYPAELLARIDPSDPRGEGDGCAACSGDGASDGNRTHAHSLEGCCTSRYTTPASFSHRIIPHRQGVCQEISVPKPLFSIFPVRCAQIRPVSALFFVKTRSRISEIGFCVRCAFAGKAGLSISRRRTRPLRRSKRIVRWRCRSAARPCSSCLYSSASSAAILL